jgi:imidazolonepropionase-like amidohydrolase
LVLALPLTRSAAQQAPAARPPLTVIRAGKLIDTDRGEVLQNQLILVRGDKIESVQAAASVAPPRDATVIDLSRYTVTPGLIDCHTHLIDDGPSGGVRSPLERSEAQMAFSGVRNARTTLLAGFTTVRDVGVFRAFVDVALRDAINQGTVPGPRMAVAGAYITVSTGGGEVSGVARDIVLPPSMKAGIANSADEVRQRVRELLHGGADFIKVIATGAVFTNGTTPGAPEYSEAELKAAVDEAALYGTYVAAHAHSAEGIKRAVRAGVRSIEHGSYLDDEGIALMKERGTYLDADIYNGDYTAAEGKRLGLAAEIMRKNDETTTAQRDGFRKAAAAGVKMAYGTDAVIYPHGDNAKQLPYMARYGLTPMQAIQSATINSATMMGWKDRVGSIAPGKFADLIAVEGDPLADLSTFSRVRFVMKGGTVYKSPTSGSPTNER